MLAYWQYRWKRPFGVTVRNRGRGARVCLEVERVEARTLLSIQLPRSFSVGIDPTAVVIADVNGDGKPDIITANFGSNDVSVLLGNGDGTFQAAQDFAVGT